MDTDCETVADLEEHRELNGGLIMGGILVAIVAITCLTCGCTYSSAEVATKLTDQVAKLQSENSDLGIENTELRESNEALNLQLTKCSVELKSRPLRGVLVLPPETEARLKRIESDIAAIVKRNEKVDRDNQAWDEWRVEFEKWRAQFNRRHKPQGKKPCAKH